MWASRLRMTATSALVAVTSSGCELLPQNDGEWTAVWIIVGVVVVGAVGFAVYMGNKEG